MHWIDFFASPHTASLYPFCNTNWEQNPLTVLSEMHLLESFALQRSQFELETCRHSSEVKRTAYSCPCSLNISPGMSCIFVEKGGHKAPCSITCLSKSENGDAEELGKLFRILANNGYLVSNNFLISEVVYNKGECMLKLNK